MQFATTLSYSLNEFRFNFFQGESFRGLQARQKFCDLCLATIRLIVHEGSAREARTAHPLDETRGKFWRKSFPQRLSGASISSPSPLFKTMSTTVSPISPDALHGVSIANSSARVWEKLILLSEKGLPLSDYPDGP